jgi:hypothetical protein
MGSAVVGCHTPPASVTEPLELPELEPLELPELEPPELLPEPELPELPEPPELEPDPPELEELASFCPLPCDELPDDEHATAATARSQEARANARGEPMAR